ncbi:MAG: HAD-IA family hydrolase [Armatimonadetes bacterium]|nr:HAD-IA family hydrolase [Armatimonadota bacterium]
MTEKQSQVLKGVIFDMDGVLVDSEWFIAEAAIRMFAQHNVRAKREDFLPFVGAGEDRYLGGVAEQYGVKLDMSEAKLQTYRIYGELLHGQVEPLPGAVDFIGRCRARGLKIAVASAADRIKVDINLREIGLDSQTFDAVVSGSDVVHKKPDPEIFLKAASRLGLQPSECLVVEDAVNGVEAARRGGFRALGITTSFSAEQLHWATWHAADLASAPPACLEW